MLTVEKSGEDFVPRILVNRGETLGGSGWISPTTVFPFHFSLNNDANCFPESYKLKFTGR